MTTTTKGTSAPKTAPAKNATTIVTKKAAPKKAAPKKAAPKKAKVKKPGISDLLKQIMVPKTGTICAVTYAEANVAVVKAFPKREKLYLSEFDRNFDKLKNDGKLTAKKSTNFDLSKKTDAAKK
jgi:adenylate kinase